jgi:GNAT superfamily N-acetyltransferase
VAPRQEDPIASSEPDSVSGVAGPTRGATEASLAAEVRPAIPGDAARLAVLSAELGYPASEDLLARRLGQLLARNDQLVLVAEAASGEVVGWVHGSEQHLLESGPRCELLGLVVDARQRGRGIGRALVAAVEDWAAARGLEQMAVRSNVVRSESHPFYERLGYTRVKTQHAYRKRIGRTAPPAA